METLHGIDGLRKLPQGAIISIGNFDGIHLGHQRILQTSRNLASQHASLAVVTFEPHPLTVLRPQLAPPRLTVPQRKAELLDQSPLPFARDDAALRPIVLLLCSELILVVGLRLASRERLGNGQHRDYYPRRLRLCWALTFRSASLCCGTISVAVRGDFRGAVGTVASGLSSCGRNWGLAAPMFLGS